MAYPADAIANDVSTDVSDVHLDYAELVDRACQTDRAASDLLADNLYPKIWGVAYAYCTNDLLAEDLVQEAMLTIYGRLHRYDPTYPFIPWAMRIAEGRFKDLLRKRRAEIRSSPAGTMATADTDRLGAPSADARPGPEEELVKADESRRLREALTRLPKLQRQIIALHWFSGLSYETIAADLHLDKNEVYRLSFVARQRLGKMLLESEERLS